MVRKDLTEVKAETDMEVSARRKQHQAGIRRGLLSKGKPDEAESGADIVRRRRREHQAKLKGGM